MGETQDQRNVAKVLLLLVPGLVALMTPAWIEAHFGDDWYWHFFGYFRNYHHYLTDFVPNRFQGARVTALAPAALAFEVFTPRVAAAACALAFLYAALLSLNYTIKTRFPSGPTLQLTALALLSPDLLYAASGLASTGTACAFLFLCLALSQRSADQDQAWLRAAGAAGAAGAAAAIADPCALLPAMLIAAVPVAGRQATPLKRMAAMVTGAALLVAGTALLDRATIGRPFFLADLTEQLDTWWSTVRVAGRDAPAWYTMHWLVLPVTVISGCAAALLRGRRSDREILYWVLATAMIAGLAEAAGIPLVRNRGFASYLLPVWFLGLTALANTGEPAPAGSPIPIAPLLTIAALSNAVVAMLPLVQLYRLAQAVPDWLPAAALATAIAGGITATRSGRSPALVLLLAVAFTPPVKATALGNSLVPHHHRVVIAQDYILRIIGPHRQPRLWYRLDDGHADEYQALQDVFFGAYPVFGQNYPAIETAATAAAAGQWVAHLTTAPDQEGMAVQALRSHGLTPRLVARQWIGDRERGFAVVIWHLQPREGRS